MASNLLSVHSAKDRDSSKDSKVESRDSGTAPFRKQSNAKRESVKLARDFVSRSLVESSRSQEVPHVPAIFNGNTFVEADVSCEGSDWSEFPVPGDDIVHGFVSGAKPIHLKPAPDSPESKENTSNPSAKEQKEAIATTATSGQPLDLSLQKLKLEKGESHVSFGDSVRPSTDLQSMDGKSEDFNNDSRSTSSKKMEIPDFPVGGLIAGKVHLARCNKRQARYHQHRDLCEAVLHAMASWPGKRRKAPDLEMSVS